MNIFNFISFISDFIFSLIDKEPILSVFFGTFLLGDEMVYFFAFLSGAGLIKLWIVIIFSILGNGSCDIFWFFVAKYDYLKRFRKLIKKTEEKKFKKEEKILEALSEKKLYFTLLLSKFFYGTRLLTIFYVAKKEKKLSKIIFYNTIAVITWVVLVSFVMFYIGKWTAISFDSVRYFHRLIGYAIVFIIIIFLFNKFVLKNILMKIKLNDK